MSASGQAEDAPPAPPSVGGRAAVAALWVVLLRVVVRGASAIRILIVAQLLAPGDIGIFGIALLAMFTLEQFSESGFREALIQTREEVNARLASAWTFQIMRGALLSALLIVFAYPIAGLFGEPEAAGVLRAVGAVVAIRSCENVAIVFLQKDLTFGRYFIYEAVGSGSDLVISIVAALVWPSYWALLLGLLAATLARTTASYVLSPWRPSFAFDLKQLRELFSFGRWVYLNRVTAFIAIRADQFVVARILGATALGVYQMAFLLADLLTKEIVNTLGIVAFPAYSLIQTETARLRSAFLMAFEVVASLVLPLTLVGILLARPIVDTVLPGAEWSAVADMLPYLLGAGALRSLVATGGAVYMAVGRPVYSFQINAGRAVLLCLAIWPLVSLHHLVGAGIAVLVSAWAMLPPFVLRLRQLLRVSSLDLLTAIAPGAVLTVAVGLACEGGQLVEVGPPLLLPLVGAVCAYAAASFGLWQTTRTGPFRLASRIRTYHSLAGRSGHAA